MPRKPTNEERNLAAFVAAVLMSALIISSYLDLSLPNDLWFVPSLMFLGVIVLTVAAMMFGKEPYEPPFFKVRWHKWRLRTLEDALKHDEESIYRLTVMQRWLQNRIAALEGGS